LNRYDQRMAEETIIQMLERAGYEVKPPVNVGASVVYTAEKEGSGGRFIVRYMPVDPAYKNSLLPYTVYKIDAWTDASRYAAEKEAVDFVVGYNPTDKSFACVPITEFKTVRSVVVHQREGLRSRYYNTWHPMEEQVAVDFGESKQWFKGLTSLSGYTDALLKVSGAAEGIPTEQFIERVQTLFPALKGSSSANSYISSVRQLGLIEQKEGLWTRTELGNRYLETQDPEVLRSILLGHYASIYKILWELRRQGELNRDSLQDMLGEYLGWASTFGTAAQIRWCDSFGLIQILDDNVIRLSERGMNWANDLTDEPPQLTVSASVEAKHEGIFPSRQPTFTFDFALIQSRIKSMNLIYKDDLLPSFHAGLHALSHKHFVILSGISGTGKTKLAQAYANAVYGLELHEENPHLLIVAVQPQWNDATSLLGYLSPVTKQYYRTAFLDFLLRASADEKTGTPYFVCLDEMNLAMVEHYFSDFLSAWESGAPLDLHTGDGLVTGVPRQVKIPSNLYVIGTVNVDESTHAFSKKVLDRAFVLELSDVDYDTYAKKRVENPRVYKLISMVKFVGEKMKPFHLHVGYRVLDEMGAYLENYPVSVDDLRLIDGLMMQKVLPRIHGDERMIPALRDIREYFSEELGRDAVSVQRLDEMISEVESTGMCQFWR
jgi:hypothetical protein